jgi:hypothetical protein
MIWTQGWHREVPAAGGRGGGEPNLEQVLLGDGVVLGQLFLLEAKLDLEARAQVGPVDGGPRTTAHARQVLVSQLFLRPQAATSEIERFRPAAGIHPDLCGGDGPRRCHGEPSAWREAKHCCEREHGWTRRRTGSNSGLRSRFGCRNPRKPEIDIVMLLGQRPSRPPPPPSSR